MSEITSCIHHVPIFRVLPQSSVARLQRAMQHVHLEPGEQVLSLGDTVQHLIVVARGRLRLSRTSRSGREQSVRELGPGDFFGEMALFTEVACEGDLVALARTDVCSLERTAVQAELKQHPEACWRLLQSLAQRLVEAERTIGDLALLDVGERLVSELVRLAEVGAHVEEGIRIEMSVPWAQLATKLGTTPESLSRRWTALQSSGLIAVEGRNVVLRDLNGLKAMLNGS